MDGVGWNDMRKCLAALVFGGCVLMASPLSAAPATTETTAAAASPASAIQQARVPIPGLRDEAAMLLVGTALIGLASAVRRAA